MTVPTSLFAEFEAEVQDQLTIIQEQADRPRFNNLTRAEQNELVLSVQHLARGEAIRHGHHINRTNEIDDLTSIALVGIVEASKTFQEERGTKFSTWATAWMRRCLIRESAKLESAIDLESWDHIADDAEESTGEIDTRTPNAEQALLLSTLPESSREIVRLAVFERMAPDQIAAFLHLPVKDVKLQIRNAGQSLTSFIERDESPNNLFAEVYPAEPNEGHVSAAVRDQAEAANALRIEDALRVGYTTTLDWGEISDDAKSFWLAKAEANAPQLTESGPCG